ARRDDRARCRGPRPALLNLEHLALHGSPPALGSHEVEPRSEPAASVITPVPLETADAIIRESAAHDPSANIEDGYESSMGRRDPYCISKRVGGCDKACARHARPRARTCTHLDRHGA